MPSPDRGKDETTLPPPWLLTTDAAGHPDDDRARNAAAASPEPETRPHLPRGEEPGLRVVRTGHGRTSAGVILPRLAYVAASTLLAATIAATVTSTIVFVILPQIDDWELADPQASREPPLAQTPPPATELSTVATWSEPERQYQPNSLQPDGLRPVLQFNDQPAMPQPALTSQPAVQGEERPPENAGETASPPTAAALEPAPSASPPLRPQSLPPNDDPPHDAIAAQRGPGDFQFTDSDVRHLTAAELQKLPARRLRIARNEIFARKGRYFKDDALRSYFEQFPWYQPRAWDVALNAVEQGNVGQIQSIETAAERSRLAPGPGLQAAETGHEDSGSGSRFPNPHRQYLTPEQLQGLSADQLALVRNEIFARKGRHFKDPALRAFFAQFPWYRPYAWEVSLSAVEQANVDLIQSVETAKAGHSPPM